jgi:hypothetical protein
MTEASKTYKLIEPFLKNDLASLFQKTGKGKGQDTNDIFIQLYDVSKEVIFDYSYSNAGLVAAIAASAAGDLIFIPAGTLTITAGFTVPTGVTLTGAGEYATFITATENYGNLISLSSDSCIESLNINYTGGSTKLMTLVTNHSGQIIRNIHAYFYPNSAVSSHCFHTGTNTEFKLIENCIFVCDGSGGERTGMYASIVGGSARFIRNTYGYGHCNTASVNAYGISIKVTVSQPIILENCYGYGYAQGGTIGYGIYTDGTVESYSCHGYGRSGTSVSFGFSVVSGAVAHSCRGEAINDGGGTRYGLLNSSGYMYSCSNLAAFVTYGIAVYGTAYAVGCKFEGGTADILLNTDSIFHVYACQYETTAGTGAIYKDEGDLRLGTGTDNRIVQWNGTGGDLEDSNLVGPVSNLLNLTNAAAGTTLAMQFPAGRTLTLIGSLDANRTLTIAVSGHIATCDGTEVANRLAYWTGGSVLDDLDNSTGVLHNDGIGNFTYLPITEAPAWALNIDGALATATNVGAFVSPGDGTILAVYIYCKTLGTANSTIVDCNKNDVTIFTDQDNRPTLAWDDADSYDKSGAPDITTLAEGDIVTFDIDAIATGAADISIILAVKWTSIVAAPADPEYVVGAASGALTNEIVKEFLGDNYDPDVYPTSPDALDDEFNDPGSIDLKWTLINDPAGASDHLNTGDYPGFLYVGLTELGTDNFDNTIRIYQAPPAANHAWEIIARVNIAASGLGGEGDEFAGVYLYLGNSVNDQFATAGYFITDYLASTSNIYRAVIGQVDNGSGAFTAMSSSRAQAISAGQFVYLKLCKTTEEAYTNANTYTAYCSINGIIWDQVGSCSKTFTTACDECGLMFRRPKAQTGTPRGEAIVDFFRRTL